MIINPPDIISCPICNAEQLRGSLASGNTFGAMYFSDGSMMAPMLPREPVFVMCRKCKVFFKITPKTVKGRVESGDNRPYVLFLTIEEGLKAIADGLVNGEQEGSKEWKDDMLGLRVELWWAFNKRLRGASQFTDKIWQNEGEKAAYVDNCRELLSLLSDGENDENHLHKAEILRNIGAFDECRQMLDKIENREKYEHYITAIRKKADEENTITFQIS